MFDSDMYRKPFMKRLPADCKLFWSYLLLDCDHAGFWEVELDVANIRLGVDLTEEGLLEAFEGKIIDCGDGKWFVPSFIEFQYGELKEGHRVHDSVIKKLKSKGFCHIKLEKLKGIQRVSIPFPNSSERDKEKEKDKVKVKEKEKDTPPPSSDEPPPFLEILWKQSPSKARTRSSKKQVSDEWRKTRPKPEQTAVLLALEQWKSCQDWQKQNGEFVPGLHLWIRNRKWEAPPDTATAEPKQKILTLENL